MATRFLRADWHRASRLCRAQGSIFGSTLFREATATRDHHASAASRLNSAGLIFASAGSPFASGNQFIGRTCDTLAASSSRSVDSLRCFSSISSSTSRRFGSVNPKTVTAGRQYDSGWRGGWKGGLCSSHQGHQQAGRRFLGSRRGKAAKQS